jgi:hypothetical protein
VETSRLGWFVLASIAAVLAVTAHSLSFATTSGLFSSADESAHIDYAYQVWHGGLPVFEEGLAFKPEFGYIPPVQWVAQHPPLYYAVIAPVVGPLVDAGHVVAAGYGARAVNALIAGALVAALIWGTRQIFPGAPHVALAAGLVAASNSWVVRVGGSVYNDAFAALWAALLLGMTVRVIRFGLTPRRTALLAAYAAAGVLSRASVAVVLFLCLLAVVLLSPSSSVPFSQTRVAQGGRRSSRARALLAAGLVGAAAVAAAGWFYLRNLRLTGRLLGGNPEWAESNLGRQTRPVLDVATSAHSWESLLNLFSYNQLPTVVGTLLLAVPAALGLLAVVLAWPTIRGPDRRRSAAVVVFLVAVVAAVLAQQLVYTAGGGALNPRYVLPVLLPIVSLLALGLVLPKRVAAVLTALWVAVAQADFLRFVLSGARAGTTGLPSFPDVALASAGVGLGFLALALLSLHRGVGAAGAEVTVTTEDERHLVAS